MNRRISQKRELALRQLRDIYRDRAMDKPYVSTNAQMGIGMQAAGIYRYARNWLLATGELPTGIHEVPWGFNPPYSNSKEVDFDPLHVPSSLPVPEPAR